MVRLALLASSCSFLFSCAQHEPSKPVVPVYDADSISLVERHGIVLKNALPLTGVVIRKKETGFRQEFLEGKKHGWWQENFPGGARAFTRHFDRGVKTDSLLEWWPNGQMKTQAFFQAGEYEGRYRTWAENGMLISDMNYRAGKEEGEQKLFDEKGNVKANYVIRDGRRFGLLGTRNCVNVTPGK